MTPYFAYGSNLDPRGMQYRCPGAVEYGSATLAGWRLTFHGVADVEPSPEDLVHGAVWLCDDDHMASLDRYEGASGELGDPNGFYRRELVDVVMDDGTELEAVVYVMNPSIYDRRSAPTQSYLDTIHRGFDHFGLPVEALRDALARTQARLLREGVRELVSDGRKRLRPVAGAPAPTRRKKPTKGRGSRLPANVSAIDARLL